jgi:hypothetical protein
MPVDEMVKWVGGFCDFHKHVFYQDQICLIQENYKRILERWYQRTQDFSYTEGVNPRDLVCVMSTISKNVLCIWEDTIYRVENRC